MKKNIVLLVFVGMLQLECLQAQTNATMRLVFPFEVSNVQLLSWWPAQTVQLNQIGPREFEGAAQLTSNSLICSIKYNINGFNGDYWVSGGNKYTGHMIPNRLDVHGIKCAKVFVNNQMISNLYTIKNWYGDGADIAFRLNAFGGIEPFNDADHPHFPTDDRIPSEVHHHHAYLNTEVPYASDQDIAGWIVALSDNNFMEPSIVEVDYIRVYGLMGSAQTLLCEQNYDFYNPVYDGGLYLRYPFFPIGYDQHDPLPASLSAGILSVTTSDYRTYSPHLWSNHHYASNWSTYDGYRLHCRVRITGHAVVQGGIDFRDASQTVHELGVSDWCFHGNGQWQDVVFDTRDFVANNSIVGKLSLYNANEAAVTDVVYSDFYMQLFDNGVAVGVPQVVNSDGTFSFEDLELGKAYSMRIWEQSSNGYLDGSWGWNNWGGATALDALIISYMTVGNPVVEEFPWIDAGTAYDTSPFAMRTADVNLSGTLSGLDALTLMYRTVGYPGTSPFPGGKPNFLANGKQQTTQNTLTWPNAPDITFDTYGVYQGGSLSNTVYQEAILPALSSGQNVVNVFLTATGDLNASYGAGTRTSMESDIGNKERKKVGVNTETELSFYFDGEPYLAAFNVNLGYRPDLIDILYVKSCKIYNIDKENSMLKLAWMDSEGKTYGVEEPFLKVGVKVKKEIHEGEALFSIAAGASYADTNARELSGIRLLMDQVVTTTDENEEVKERLKFRQYPNPFNENTSLIFKLEESSDIRLVISDVMGKKVHERIISRHPKGKVRMDVSRQMLGTEGIYSYVIEIDDGKGEASVIKGKLVMVGG